MVLMVLGRARLLPLQQASLALLWGEHRRTGSKLHLQALSPLTSYTRLGVVYPCYRCQASEKGYHVQLSKMS